MQRRHRVSWFVCSSAFVLVASAAAFAGDLAVPRDYRTVEEALAAALPGDRVLVRGGTFENVHVKKGAVEIVARGTTVLGYVWIDASNVTVSGIRLGRNGRIVITGSDVSVTGTKGTGPGRRVISVQGGRRARIEGNKLAAGDIEVLNGTDATVAHNRLKTGEILAAEYGTLIDSNAARSITASGGQTSVLDNRCRDLLVEEGSCDVANNVVSDSIDVKGDDTSVLGNEVRGWINVQGEGAEIGGNSLARGGIVVWGDGASVVSNTVEQSPIGVGVHGDGFTISGNDLTAIAPATHDGPAGGFGMCPGIGVSNAIDGGTVTDNVVTHRTGVGITIDGSNVTVSGNDVHGIAM